MSARWSPHAAVEWRSGAFGDQRQLRLACLADSDDAAQAFRTWIDRMPPVEVRVFSLREDGVQGQVSRWAAGGGGDDGQLPLALCAFGSTACSAAMRCARELEVGGGCAPQHVVLIRPGPAPDADADEDADSGAAAARAAVGRIACDLLVLDERAGLDVGASGTTPPLALPARVDAGAWATAAAGRCARFLLQLPAPMPRAATAGGSAARAWLQPPPLFARPPPSPLAAALSFSGAFEQVLRTLCTAHLCLPMHELVLRQACRTPDRPACKCGGVSLSYAQFVAAAHAIACRAVAATRTRTTTATAGGGEGGGSTARAALRGAAVRGQHVVVCMPKREELPLSYLATYMLRCPVSTIDLRNTAAMIAYQLDLWQPALVLCRRAQDVPASVPAHVLRVEIGDLRDAWQSGAPSPLLRATPQEVADTWLAPPADAPPAPEPELELRRDGTDAAANAVASSPLLWDRRSRMMSVAFIEWTSGTTGRPKGAEVTHHGMVHWLFWRWWLWPVVAAAKPAHSGGSDGLTVVHGGPFNGCATDEYVSAMNLFFIWYWHVPLAMGGTLLVVPDEVQMDVAQLPAHLEASGATRIECLTPSLLRVMLEVCSAEELRDKLRRVVYCMTSGEALPLDVARLYFSKMPRTCRLYNILACTETSSDIVWCELTAEMIDACPSTMRYAPCGQPVWNVEPQLRALRADVAESFGASVGELAIRAPNIYAGGYFQRPDLSNQKFPPAEFGENADGLIVATYCTGDVASWVELGEHAPSGISFPPVICILGRADGVVKVRGHRIETDSVEEVLNSVSGVLDAAVVVMSAGDADGSASVGESLLAFVAFKFANKDKEARSHGASLLPAFGDVATQARVAELMQVLREKLPKSHIPDHIVSILPEQLEYTITGKLNRKKLLAFYRDQTFNSTPPPPDAPSPPSATDAPAAVADTEAHVPPDTVARDAPASEETALPTTLQEWRWHVAAAWSDLLPQGRSVSTIVADPSKSFFDSGGHSLLAMRLAARLKLPVTDLFQFDTLDGQARHLWQKHRNGTGRTEGASAFSQHGADGGDSRGGGDGAVEDDVEARDVAVIGIAGRFAGAASAADFWSMICDGREGITDLTEEQMIRSGAPADLVRLRPAAGAKDASDGGASATPAAPHWVARTGAVPGECITGFDIGFWGWRRSEAQVTDPAGRMLMECAYEAIEMAGYDPFDTNSDARVSAAADSAAVSAGVGVYVCGGSLPHHAEHVVAANGASADGAVGALEMLRLREPAAYLEMETGCEKDYTATRMAFALDLRGPAISIGTACSSALVAVVTAVHALRKGECTTAIAGGASVFASHDGSQHTGYLYQPGMIFSPDGRCRTFDDRASGTINTNGASVLFLKPLPAARAHQDDVIAVIRGAAMNNDGQRKVGFSAPSVEGQVQVVTAALSDADRRHVVGGSGGAAPATWLPSPYLLECHGTATPLGDPVELAALKQALAPDSTPVPDGWYCAIGSAKTNVGHANTAAGGVGLLKAVLCVQNAVIPPSLHFQRPNKRAIGLSGRGETNGAERGPFVVQTELSDWPAPASNGPRMAGVSSFGVGGTNAHVVLAQCLELESVGRGASDTAKLHDEHYILALTARTAAGLDGARRNVHAALLAAANMARSTELEAGTGSTSLNAANDEGVSGDSDSDSEPDGDKSKSSERACPKWMACAATATSGEVRKPGCVELRDIEFTLMCGRRHHEHRAGILCSVPQGAPPSTALLMAASALSEPLDASDDNSQLQHRVVVRGHAPPDAIGLSRVLVERKKTRERDGDDPLGRRVALAFPGQGAQFDCMGIGLCGVDVGGAGPKADTRSCQRHMHCPVYRRAFGACCDVLRMLRAVDAVAVAIPHAPGFWGGVDLDLSTSFGAQLGVFITSYSIACSLLSRHGIAPDFVAGVGGAGALVAVLGHSVGEYAAATIAGVFELATAMRIVAERGRLMDELMQSQEAADSEARPGAMVSLSVGESDAARIVAAVLEFAPTGLSLEVACLNAPSNTVVSGDTEAVGMLEEAVSKHNAGDGDSDVALRHILNGRRVRARRLKTAGAFHSALLDPMLPKFRVFLSDLQNDCISRGVPFASEPRVAMLSNVTGTWLEPQEATSVDYWVRQVRAAVRFSDCVATLQAAHPPAEGGGPMGVALLEAGPGTGCCSLAQMTLTAVAGQQSSDVSVVIPSMRHPRDVADKAFVSLTQNEPADDVSITQSRCAIADRRALKTCAAKLWSLGVVLNWEILLRVTDVSLRRTAMTACPPSYAWQRTTCWPGLPPRSAAPAPAEHGAASTPTGGSNSAFDSLWYRVDWRARPLPQHPAVPAWMARALARGAGQSEPFRSALSGAAAAVGITGCPVLLDSLDAASGDMTREGPSTHAEREKLAGEVGRAIGQGLPCCVVPHCDEIGDAAADLAMDAAVHAAEQHSRVLFVGLSTSMNLVKPQAFGDAGKDPQHVEDRLGFRSCLRLLTLWQRLQRLASRRGVEGTRSRVPLELWVVVPPELQYAAVWGLAKSAAIEGAASGVLMRRVLWDAKACAVGKDATGKIVRDSEKYALALEILATAQFGSMGSRPQLVGAQEIPTVERPSYVLGTAAGDAVLEEVQLGGSLNNVAARRVPRLVRCAPPRTLGNNELHNSYGIRRGSGLYLVTGGARGIGLEVALRLARRGAAALLLVSRSAPSASTLERLRLVCENEQKRRSRRKDADPVPLRIACVRCDIADANSVSKLFSALRLQSEAGTSGTAFGCTVFGPHDDGDGWRNLSSSLRNGATNVD